MTFLHVSREQQEDASYLDLLIHDMAWAMLAEDLPPPTPEQLESGYATYPHQDHEHTIEVGRRAEKTRADADAQREAEMAACPYVACTCGHHEE